jgi:hypothetical protein
MVCTPKLGRKKLQAPVNACHHNIAFKGYKQNK